MPKSGFLDTEKYSTALVTGASSGIGLAIAGLLQDKGVRVYGTSRFPDKEGLPGSVRWIEFDGSSQAGLEAFLEQHSQLLSKVDILINNAGSSYFGEATDIPADIRKQQQTLLVEAPKRLTQTALEAMKKRDHGAIINVSSLAALFTVPYLEDYSHAKAALSSYTQDIITECAHSGLTIIDFQPGDYRTQFNNNIVRYGQASENQDKVWKQMQRNIMKAPPPEKAARDIYAAILAGKSRTLRSGTLFQSKIAPAGKILLPDPVIAWAIRKYYRIP